LPGEQLSEQQCVSGCSCYKGYFLFRKRSLIDIYRSLRNIKPFGRSWLASDDARQNTTGLKTPSPATGTYRLATSTKLDSDYRER
jgi:hypothetical protein